MSSPPVLDRYEIVEVLGQGSMGVVYRARQAGTSRDVAVKVLRPERGDPMGKARFLREVRACSALRSPHAVRVFDFGETRSGDPFFVMELLQGESLAARLNRVGCLSVRAALATAREVLLALEEAHQHGLVHRDIKPSNVFYAHIEGGAEVVKVLDFGSAKFLPSHERHAALNAADSDALTIIGTPNYMSPEQARSEQLDPRSDIYSLGAVLYRMLTGRPPFTDRDRHVLLARHINDVPERPSVARPEAQIPLDVEVLVTTALAKDRARRPTATAMRERITTLLDAAPRTSTPPPAAVLELVPPVEEPTTTEGRLLRKRPARAPWVIAGSLFALAAAILGGHKLGLWGGAAGAALAAPAAASTEAQVPAAAAAGAGSQESSPWTEVLPPAPPTASAVAKPRRASGHRTLAPPAVSEAVSIPATPASQAAPSAAAPATASASPAPSAAPSASPSASPSGYTYFE